jgi:hypothetical protein
MFEFIAFVIFMIAFVGLLLDNLRLKNKITGLNIQLLQVALDRNIMIDKINKREVSIQPIEDSEAFFKFLSDSREWAFKYIEDVQGGIVKFIDEVDPSVEYFDSYGEVMETPLHPIMRKISLAYKDLKKFIPDDYGKIEQ